MKVIFLFHLHSSTSLSLQPNMWGQTKIISFPILFNKYLYPMHRVPTFARYDKGDRVSSLNPNFFWRGWFMDSNPRHTILGGRHLSSHQCFWHFLSPIFPSFQSKSKVHWPPHLEIVWNHHQAMETLTRFYSSKSRYSIMFFGASK